MLKNEKPPQQRKALPVVIQVPLALVLFVFGLALLVLAALALAVGIAMAFFIATTFLNLPQGLAGVIQIVGTLVVWLGIMVWSSAYIGKAFARLSALFTPVRKGLQKE